MESQKKEHTPWISLFSAVAFSFLFILFGRLTEEIALLPLIALISLISLPILYVVVVFRTKKATILISTRQMRGPIILSLLIFPGFLFSFSHSFAYSDLTKLVLVFLSVMLLFKSWRLKRTRSFFLLITAVLIFLLVLAVLLSNGFKVWPLLWAEGMMALAAVSIYLYHVLMRIWCTRNALGEMTAHFWSTAWSILWILGATWISGEGLPLPPLSSMKLATLGLWAVLYSMAFFMIPEIEGRKNSGGFVLIDAFFLPCFVIVLGFLEYGQWPDFMDFCCFLCIIAGSLMLSFIKGTENE